MKVTRGQFLKTMASSAALLSLGACTCPKKECEKGSCGKSDETPMFARGCQINCVKR